MVAHSISARYKYHRCGTSSAREDTIVTRATGHFPNQAVSVGSVFEEGYCCCFDAIDCFGLELDGLRVKIRLYTSVLVTRPC